MDERAEPGRRWRGQAPGTALALGAALLAAAVAVLLLALVALEPARAAFPGDNGRIAFQSYEVTSTNPEGDVEVFTMNPDGTDIKQITANTAEDGGPAWSPDGKKIAFVSGRDGNYEIYTMNADGTNQTRLTNNSTALDSYPAWSPDGTQITFVSDRDGNWEIYKMQANGASQTRLTNNSANDFSPAWSPNGTQIAFTTSGVGSDFEVYTMDADGANQTNLTNNPSGSEQDPVWSPDGTQIAFQRNLGFNPEVFTMKADGTDPTNLTNNPASDYAPAWSPDGTQIAFISDRVDNSNAEIYTMNADGTNQTRRTNTPNGYEVEPDWQPLVATPPDTTNPGITITTPAEGAQYTLNQDVKADYQCNDEAGGSGLRSCAGPVANGAAIDTSSLGTKSFTVNAEDNAGNKSALTRTYEVVGDTTRPTVISVSPAENATGVPRNTNVSATFSEAMDEASVETSGVVKLVRQGRTTVLAASVTYDAATRKVTLDPTADLEAGTTYRATVSTGAKDAAGNALAADKTWTFTTAGTPPPPIDTNPLPNKLRNDLIVFSSDRVTPDNPHGDLEIFVMNLTFGASVTQLTFNQTNDSSPVWSPDGKKIAFVRYPGAGIINGEIYVMNANGLAQTRLTNNDRPDGVPTWSPDGKQIAFERIPGVPFFEVTDWEIFKMQANGANQVQLTNNTDSEFDPAWSPNGQKIAFTRFEGSCCLHSDIFTMKSDGSDQTNLTNSATVHHGAPAWSPNGQKIAYAILRDGLNDIYTMNANGANQVRRTNSSESGRSNDYPVWSPEGTFIAFMSYRDGNHEIYTMKADGSQQANRTNNPALDQSPDWLKQ